MSRTIVIAGVLMLAGIGAAAWIAVTPESPDARQEIGAAAEKLARPAPILDASASTDERLAALEIALAAEREARVALEEQLRELLVVARAADAPGDGPAPGAMVAGTTFSADGITVLRGGRTTFGTSVDQLVDAGFSPERADWIRRREESIRMELMQAQFAARQGTAPANLRELMRGPDAILRDELGEADYERYLEASGRPTAVVVGNVLDSSPAQAAGLQPGDEILRYNGSRVYHVGELVQHTMGGTPGTNVVVDVMRDGVPMQIVLPAGPMGVTPGAPAVRLE